MDFEYSSLLNKVLKGYDSITPLYGGMMNQAFLVTAFSKKYILYIPTKQANEMVNRNLEHKIQSEAQENNLTSRNIYLDNDTGIKINEYLEGSSLDKCEFVDYKKIADLLFKYHSTCNKCGVYYSPFKRLENYYQEASKFVTDFDPQIMSLIDLLKDNQKYLESWPTTLAHNDAQRSNIVYSLDKYYLIDFEFAADNDPIYDIASFGNNDVFDGLKLLEEYTKLGDFKDAKKRYILWRIFISLQWYFVALIKHYRGEGKTHNFNFLDVADYFIKNAQKAYSLF